MDGHIGISLGAIAAITGIIGAAMAGLGAPWAAWIGFAIWSVLWVTAALGLSDTASRNFLAGTLRKSTFTQIYTALARRNVMAVWSRLCDPAPDAASLPTFLRAALTWRLYDFALLLAVAYPILLLVSQWVVTGAEGQVGSFVVLPEAGFWPERLSIILLMAFLVAGGWFTKSLATPQSPLGGRSGDWIVGFLIVGTFAGIVVGVAAGVIPFPGGSGVALLFVIGTSVILGFTSALMFGFSPAFGLGFPIIFPFAVLVFAELSGGFAGSLGGALAVICAVVTEFLVRRGKPVLARILLTVGIACAVLIVAVSLNWAELPEDVRSLFLFLTVLPLLNALFDVVSYALTLSLIRRGLRSGLPFLWGLADLGLACVLLLGLGAVLVAVIHWLNLLAGVPFLDLPGLFAGVQAEPGAYVWLYLMLFSTLLPTLLHAFLSLLGVQGIWPRALRRPIAGWVEAAPASPLHALRASLGLSLIWTLPLLALTGVLWLIWHYAQPALIAGLQLYLEGLVWIAAAPVGAI